MRGSKTIRQLKLVCQPEVRREGIGVWGGKGRKFTGRST